MHECSSHYVSNSIVEVVDMPRGPRAQSESSIYHVMVRGINQVQLFYEEEDREAFLARLSRFKKECDFGLLAWCLMGNHVHLLIEEHEAPLATIIKKLLLSYSHWYNTKYDRKGYLYQDRFLSKPVFDDRQLLGAVRYIHRNPLEVGNGVDYWTSYRDYLGTDGPGITDTNFVLRMLASDEASARQAFAELVLGLVEPYTYSLGSERGKLLDKQAIQLIEKVAGVSSCGEVCELDEARRDEVLAELRRQGLTIRQLARLTGLNRGVVARAGQAVTREPSP